MFSDENLTRSRIMMVMQSQLLYFFSDHRKRKPKILVVQFYQKTDMPACHHRAYLLLNELKLVWFEYEVWRARGYVANHPNMPKIDVFGHFWLFCGLHNFVTL